MNAPAKRREADKPFLSVIICSHNPRESYLSQTLHSLEAQTLDRSRWELLVVDNASNVSLASRWTLKWHANARHVHEEVLGLTPARLRGIAEAAGEWLLFVDDDNVLVPSYLERCVELALSNPCVAVLGAGKLIPEFEVPPPAELMPLTSMLALRQIPEALWTNNCADVHCIAWGAGLAVRKDIAVTYRELVRQLATAGVLDRRGQQLFCGDDLFSWCAAAEGFGFGIYPELEITHLIGAGRLTRPYFLRLVHDHAFSHGVLRYLLFGRQPEPLSAWSVPRTALHGLRHGGFSSQLRWRRLMGEAAAARFIADQNLRPLSGRIFPRAPR